MGASKATNRLKVALQIMQCLYWECNCSDVSPPSNQQSCLSLFSLSEKVTTPNSFLFIIASWEVNSNTMGKRIMFPITVKGTN